MILAGRSKQMRSKVTEWPDSVSSYFPGENWKEKKEREKSTVALWRLRQEDCCDHKTILGYIMDSKLD